MRLWPNDYFGWAAQSLGFAYGSMVAVFAILLQQFLVNKVKYICVVCSVFLPVLGVLYLHVHTPEQESITMYFIRIIISFLLILLFLSISVRVSLVSKFMVYIGERSIYIFLLHGMVIDLLKEYLSDGWLILWCIVVTIFLAVCFNMFTEKIIYRLKSRE